MFGLALHPKRSIVTRVDHVLPAAVSATRDRLAHNASMTGVIVGISLSRHWGSECLAARCSHPGDRPTHGDFHSVTRVVILL